MSTVLVITRSPELARSISRYFRYLLCLEPHVLHPPMRSYGEQHVVIHDFQRIADWIESKGRDGEGIILRDAIIFIDLFDPLLHSFDELDPLAKNKGNWSATVAMLVLTFPEVQWVFNTPYKTPGTTLFRAAHVLGEGNCLKEIMEVHDSDYTALFDPTGLRLAVRNKVAQTPEATYVPHRYHVATAIDEEDDYAYFNGYMAYRLGYRCYVISSYRMMERVLKRSAPEPQAAVEPQQNGARKRGFRENLRKLAKKTALRRKKRRQVEPDPSERRNANPDEHVTLVFEDIYLNFPDFRDPNLSLSDLKVRAAEFKALDDERRRVQFRAFVTVGHDITAKKGQIDDNTEYKKEWQAKANTRKFGDVLKPVSGFFHLWEESGFMKWSREFSWDGYAGGYVWPPVSTPMPSLRQRINQWVDKLRTPSLLQRIKQWTDKLRSKFWPKQPEPGQEAPLENGAGDRNGARLRHRIKQQANKFRSKFRRKPEPLPQEVPSQTAAPARNGQPRIAVSPHDAFYAGHSALGRLLEIAERLLYRGEMNTEHIHTVADAVYGATLALDAQEYLGHRTPTTSLQALALKHRFEVNAECLFYGVAQNKEVKKRFGEINKEVVSIGRWLNPTTRKAAQFDAELGIISKLMLVFRQNYQFDEEQECLKKIRHLNRKLWCRKTQSYCRKRLKSWKAPIAVLAWGIHSWLHLGRWYVDRLINSLLWFGSAIFAWLVIFSFLYGYLCGCIGSPPSHRSEGMFSPAAQKVFYLVEQGIMHAMTAFFGLQAPHNVDQLETYGPLVVLVTIFAIGLGFVHLGIFVSHVYSVISRR